MKKLKVFLPIVLVLILAAGAVAFKAATKTAATLDYGWYVMDQGTDPTEPNSYSFRSSFDQQTEGCNGSNTVCAIYALGDGSHPDISGDPEQDDNVEEVLKKP